MYILCHIYNHFNIVWCFKIACLILLVTLKIGNILVSYIRKKLHFNVLCVYIHDPICQIPQRLSDTPINTVWFGLYIIAWFREILFITFNAGWCGSHELWFNTNDCVYFNYRITLSLYSFYAASKSMNNCRLCTMELLYNLMFVTKIYEGLLYMEFCVNNT